MDQEHIAVSPAGNFPSHKAGAVKTAFTGIRRGNEQLRKEKNVTMIFHPAYPELI
jgi:hypothetical protein